MNHNQVVLKFINRLFPLLLIVTIIAGCSSDPYENAGKCNASGTYKKFQEGIAVCTGMEGNFKYYLSGPYFEAMKLLGKAEISLLEFDSPKTDEFYKLAKQRNLENESWQTNTEISNLDLSNYAQGDTRWDSLIEANAGKLAIEVENKAALQYRFQMLNEWRAGKVSRALAYQAQQDQLEVLNRLDSAISKYNQKLAVLISEIKRIYRVSDSLEVMVFFIASEKNK